MLTHKRKWKHFEKSKHLSETVLLCHVSDISDQASNTLYQLQFSCLSHLGFIDTKLETEIFIKDIYAHRLQFWNPQESKEEPGCMSITLIG